MCFAVNQYISPSSLNLLGRHPTVGLLLYSEYFLKSNACTKKTLLKEQKRTKKTDKSFWKTRPRESHVSTKTPARPLEEALSTKPQAGTHTLPASL